MENNNGFLDEGDKGIVHWVSEILWREFYKHIIYNFPKVSMGKPFISNTSNIKWNIDESALNRWKKGETGIPIVDAGMRELWSTGYMHNRLRMIVGSFLVKNLLTHWHEGEKWFWDCLVDADLASNSASWQWVAGTGTDATPFYRNDGSTLIAPNGKPTYDVIRVVKDSSNSLAMRPWNAGALTTETAFPSQKVDANSVGASSNKLTVTVGSLGNLSGINEVQVVSQTAGNELSGDLKNLKFGTFDTTTSGTTLTLTNTNFSSAPSSGTSIALQPSRIFDLSLSLIHI